MCKRTQAQFEEVFSDYTIVVQTHTDHFPVHVCVRVCV